MKGSELMHLISDLSAGTLKILLTGQAAAEQLVAAPVQIGIQVPIEGDFGLGLSGLDGPGHGLGGDQLAQRHHLSLCAVDGDAQEPVEAGSLGAVQSQHEGDRLASRVVAQQAGADPAAVIEAKLEALADLHRDFGEQKIDLIVKRSGAEMLPVHRVARSTGIRL